MEDRNTRVNRENISGRGDEQVTGRESSPSSDRLDDVSAGAPGFSTGAKRRTSSGKSAAAAGTTSENPDVKTREIRAEIEQTREEMSETVNAIQDRLRPGAIVSNAAESVRDAASETARDVAESDSVQYVRANPIPTAMVGIGLAGLAWLAFGGRDRDEYRRERGSRRTSRDWRTGPSYYGSDDYRASSGYRGYESAGVTTPGLSSYDQHDQYGALGQRDSSGGVTDRAGEMAEDVRRKAGETTRRARQGASRAQSQLQRTWNENPMLIGAASAVLGALVGMAVPETERENQLMGEARDSMVEGVQQTVKDKVEDVQNAATNAVTQVQNAVGLSTPDDDRR